MRDALVVMRGEPIEVAPVFDCRTAAWVRCRQWHASRRVDILKGEGRSCRRGWRTRRESWVGFEFRKWGSWAKLDAFGRSEKSLSRIESVTSDVTQGV
jgi:hypothetical protein